MISSYSNKLTLVLLTYAIVLGFVIASPTVAEEGTSTISGRVVDAEGQPLDNMPIELAYVEIRKEEGGAENVSASMNTQTDSEGRFTFTNVTQGLVQFRVHSKTVLQLGEFPNPTRDRVVKFGKMAFFPHFSGFPAFGRVTFSIKPGVDIGNVEIIMERLYRMEGKIVYKNGDPLALKVVKIDFNMLRTSGARNYASSTTREIHTDPEGNFFNVVYRPAIFSLSLNYMGLSTESAPFILNNDNTTQDVVLTLNGNISDLTPPLAENPEKKKQHRPAYIPDFPAKWIMNPANGHLYKWIACDGREDAQKQANKENAYLATINSEQEQIWLEAMFGRAPYWIGLTDAKEEGKWQWENGEPVTYTNWKKKEYDPMENDDDVLPLLSAFGVKGEDQRRREDEEDYVIMSGQWSFWDEDDIGEWTKTDSTRSSYIAIIEKDSLTIIGDNK